MPFCFVCGGSTKDSSYTARINLEAHLNDKKIVSIFSEKSIECMNLISEPLKESMDLLSAEKIFAAVSSSIVIFAESNGSFVESGSFTFLKPYSQKTIICINDKYEEDDSFFKLGPVKKVAESEKEDSIIRVFKAEPHDDTSALNPTEKTIKGIVRSIQSLHDNPKDIDDLHGLKFNSKTNCLIISDIKSLLDFILIFSYFEFAIRLSDIFSLLRLLFDVKDKESMHISFSGNGLEETTGLEIIKTLVFMSTGNKLLLARKPKDFNKDKQYYYSFDINGPIKENKLLEMFSDAEKKIISRHRKARREHLLKAGELE